MTQVTLLHINADKVFQIVGALKSQGYQIGIDFDFAYHRSQWDEMIGDIPRSTIFTFYSDSVALWFSLKYA